MENRKKTGFFSFDAAYAFLLAAILLSSFMVLLSSASRSAQQAAQLRSGELFALRLSSHLLHQPSSQDAIGCKITQAWGIDAEKIDQAGLKALLPQQGRQFASVRLSDSNGTLDYASEGQPGNQTYCAARLVLASGKIARMEVCVS